LIGISLLVIGGCNPYPSKFVCDKDAPFGSCGSTPEVYSQITQGDKPEAPVEMALNPPPGERPTGTVQAVNTPVPVKTAENAYQEAILGKAASLLKKHVTPLVIPPTVGCIWFPTMLGENTDVMNMEQVVCIMLDKARFVMGDYLNRQGE